MDLFANILLERFVQLKHSLNLNNVWPSVIWPDWKYFVWWKLARDANTGMTKRLVTNSKDCSCYEVIEPNQSIMRSYLPEILYSNMRPIWNWYIFILRHGFLYRVKMSVLKQPRMVATFRNVQPMWQMADSHLAITIVSLDWLHFGIFYDTSFLAILSLSGN